MMKRRIAFILTLAIIAGLLALTSCGKEEFISTDSEVSVTESEEINSTVSGVEEAAGWSDVYANKLTDIYNCDGSNAKYYENDLIMFSLIYLNDDDIPELAISSGDFHFSTVELFTYSDGDLIFLDEFGSRGELQYSERNGLILDGFTNTGANIVSYSEFDGTEIRTLIEFNDNEAAFPEGDERIEYKINEVAVSLEEYNNQMQEYDKFDFVSAGRDYELSPNNIEEYCR